MKVALAAVAVLLLCAAPASASRVISFAAPSRYVTPAQAVTLPGSPPKPLRVNVLLPDHYTRSHCWPVLWLLHGHGQVNEWLMPDKGNARVTAKGFRGIIVMPNGGHGWYTNWWNGGTLRPAWETYHLDELLPLVMRKLPICPARRDHAIAGLSMGGEGAVYYASQRPDYFGTAISLSGTLDVMNPIMPYILGNENQAQVNVFGGRNDPSRLFYWQGHDPVTLAPTLRATRIILTTGDDVPRTPQERTDAIAIIGEKLMRGQAATFAAAAQRAGVPLTWEHLQGIHNWTNWDNGLQVVIRRLHLFSHVPPAPRNWTYMTAVQQGEAWGWKYAFDQPPTTLETLTMSGGHLSGTGSGSLRLTAPDGKAQQLQMPFTVSASGRPTP